MSALPEPHPEDAKDALHVLSSLSPDPMDRVRDDVLPRILAYVGDRDAADVPEYTDLPADAGKYTTAASLALAFAGRDPGRDVDGHACLFRTWLDNHDTTDTYDIKTVRVHEPERGRYIYVMITRLDGRCHIIGEMGFTGVYFQFNVMSQNSDFRLSRLSAYELQRDHPTEWFRDSHAYRLISGLDDGSVAWRALADGQYLTPEDVDELTANPGYECPQCGFTADSVSELGLSPGGDTTCPECGHGHGVGGGGDE